MAPGARSKLDPTRPPTTLPRALRGTTSDPVRLVTTWPDVLERIREVNQRVAAAGGDLSDPWAICARLSRKKPVTKAAKRRRSTDPNEVTVRRQVLLSLDYAEAEIIPVSEDLVFVDNHYSAWKPNGRRPEWRAMMDICKTRSLPGILVWKLDRFTRAPMDMERLIELAETQAMSIRGPKTVAVDLTTAAGRKTARDMASVAAHESDSTSERARAFFEEARRDGDPVGGERRFGFREAGSPEHHPVESILIRRAAELLTAERVDDRETTSSIADDWNANGYRTVRGGQWNARNLGRMLTHPRYNGWVEHRGVSVARMKGEPIIPDDIYERLTTMSATRKTGRRPSGTYALTGIAVCVRCQEQGRQQALSGFRRDVRPEGGPLYQYRCSRSTGGCGLTIDGPRLDGRVESEALTLLQDDATRERIANAIAHRVGRRAELEAIIEEADRELSILEERKARKDIRPTPYEVACRVHNDTIKRAEIELASLGDEDDDQGGAPLLEEVAAKFDRMTPLEKARTYVTLRLVVRVHPWEPGTAKRWRDDRVEVTSALSEPLL